MSAAQRLVGRIGRLIDARQERRASLRPATVVGRNPDGTTIVIRADGECPVRGPASGAEVGEDVFLTAARGGRRGTTDRPARPESSGEDSSAPPLATLWVESLTPNRFAAGDALTVVVAGDGFSRTTEFEFLDRDDPEGTNPDISVVARRFISATEFELDIEVDPGARVLEADLRYADPGAIG